MAELKNTFIQSKMNKDMDGRILPNGQYRDARNVQISKSEGSDVGALENMLGNELLSSFGLTDPNLEIIGHLMDDGTNTIFLFLTNYSDSSISQLENNTNNLTQVQNYIISYNTANNSFKILVTGSFLNFSKTHPIIGVNLLETLLFWTDNRNQPRKINITLANDLGYYTNEDQISVAKYYPYSPISLLTPNTDPRILFDATMQDVVSEYLPIHAAAKVFADPTSVLGTATIILDGVYTNIKPTIGSGNGDRVTGMHVDRAGSTDPIVFTVTLDQPSSQTIITMDAEVVSELKADDIIYFQRQNPLYNQTWNGDPEFLKDKFARVSYRFKFVDGEYSLSAPFTQTLFVPQQDGYFLGNNAPNSDEDQALVGQESGTFDSTVVEFMENKINNIDFIIDSPTWSIEGTPYLWNEVNSELHIIEIDILYKEASNENIFILDTLTLEDFGSNTTDTIVYNYQSRKPWKVLPERELTRVSDQVPIRALAQEVSGNRVIYGNFIDKHSSPINLDYSIQINPKTAIPNYLDGAARFDKNNYIRKEYQNHTLKQNRTYQVGVVLSDRYGRQSNVILSSIFTSTSPVSGDTIYHPYRSVEDQIINDKFNAGYVPGDETIPDTWPGDMLNIIFYNTIPSEQVNGYPGTYSINDGSISELIVNYTMSEPFVGPCGPYTTNLTDAKTGDVMGTVTFSVLADGTIVIENINQDPTYTATSGQNWTIDWGLTPIPPPPCDGNIDKELFGNLKTSQDRQLGWYSYKIVVKQTEQEYYNVYLPGAMAGYPCDQTGVTPDEPEDYPTVEFDFPKGQYEDTCHIVLFGDNINKVPRDLTEVGPQQQKFKSSVRLFGRVENFIDEPTGGDASWSNRQYDPGAKWDIAVTIGKMTELGLGDLTLNPVDKTIPPLFYQGTTDPLIGRIKTRNEFGQQQACGSGDTPYSYGPVLAVYETAPVESKLEIFWETTTSGLISDLNFSILNEDNTIPEGITNPTILWTEAQEYGDYISGTFEAADQYGNGLGPTCEIELTQVIRADGTVCTPQFELEEQGVGTGEYQIKIAPHSYSSNPGFLCWEDNTKNNYTFYFNIIKDDGISPITTTTATAPGNLYNEDPKPRGFQSLNHGQILKDNIFNNWAVMYSENEIPKIYPSNNTPCEGGGIGSCETAPGFPAYGLISTADSVTGGAYRLLSRDVPQSATLPGFLEYQIRTMQRSRTDAESTSAYGSPAGWNCEYSTGCPQPVQTIDYPWAVFDGKFQAASGAFGSDPPAFPGSAYIGNEIVYTIPRMYQVSMIGVLGFFTTPGDLPCRTQEVIFGVPYAPGVAAGQAWFGTDNSRIPSGPIYWNFDPTGNQQNFSMGGEELVGQRYNGGTPNFRHYWEDIAEIIETLYPAWPGGGQIAGAPDMVKLQQGYNTFYTPNGNGTELLGTPLGPTNAGGYGGYLGGINEDGIGPENGLMKFFPVTEPLVTDSNGKTAPRIGYIHAGSPNYPSAAFTGLIEELTDPIQGNCIPGGRYVVTLRATDRSSITPANPSGSYYEWDVPITISMWNAGGQGCLDNNT